MMRINTSGHAKVVLSMRTVKRADGSIEKYYSYWNRNPILNKLWHLRYGREGSRISKKEALRFEPE